MTNADKIRNMTDKELVEFLIKPLPYDCSDYCEKSGNGCGWTCKYSEGHNVKFMKKWLAESC